MSFGTFNNPAEAIAAIPNGRFFKIGYITELPFKAEFKRADYKIYKYTSRITRTGVAYNSLKEVKENNIQVFSRASNSNWLIKNKVKTNITTGNDYIIIAPMKKNEFKAYSYIIYHNDVVEKRCSEVPEKMIIHSYFTKKNGAVRNINLDNISFIKYGGEVIYGNIDL